MKNMSKSILLNALACPTLGWLLRSGQYIEEFSDESLTLADRFRIEQGIEIENRARQLFPNGILVDLEAISETTTTIRSSKEVHQSSEHFPCWFLRCHMITWKLERVVQLALPLPI